MKTSINSKRLTDKILVYGSCISEEHPEILKRFENYSALDTCLEEQHVSKIGHKITEIVRAKAPKEVAILSMDGSPHCIQLHYAAEETKRFFPGLKVKHFVIEGGKLVEVTRSKVRRSRHLSEL